MSKYTTQLRYICENLYDNANHDVSDVDEIISDTALKIFNFDFPIFDETYRKGLCEKIIRHFYTQEIGYETVGLWHLKLKTKMLEIMPYYNQLYESTLKDFNPFNDVDVTINKDDTVDLNATKGTKYTGYTEDSGTDKLKHRYSRTPQGGLTGIENDQYLTEATIDDKTNNNRKTYNNNVDVTDGSKTVDKYIEKITGKRGFDSYSKMLIEFRKTFLNIDMQIIDELDSLFMQIW